LVRVTRRADDSHFVNILTVHGTASGARAGRVSMLTPALRGAADGRASTVCL
jgi:hypothetical protein